MKLKVGSLKPGLYFGVRVLPKKMKFKSTVTSCYQLSHSL